MMTYSTQREGQGRWSTIQRPAAGVLWTDDDQAVGFEPAPGSSGAPVLLALDMAYDAGRTATEAFDALATLVGTRVIDGDLGHWRPNRNRSAARR